MLARETFVLKVHCSHTSKEICKCFKSSPALLLYRCSNMNAHVLLNLLNKLGKGIKYETCRAFYLFFAISLINLIIQVHEC